MRKNKVGGTNSETLSEFVVQGMLEKKASDVVVLDLRDIKHAVADYFIICSGSSDTQIDAISDSIEDQVFKLSKEWPWKVEGKQNKEWVLIDYVNVVAHVFNKERRSFYGLEELWGDAKVSTITA
ncbi:MAG: ribosome silencing factor [Bacteroidota bacterium]